MDINIDREDNMTGYEYFPQRILLVIVKVMLKLFDETIGDGQILEERKQTKLETINNDK